MRAEKLIQTIAIFDRAPSEGRLLKIPLESERGTLEPGGSGLIPTLAYLSVCSRRFLWNRPRTTSFLLPIYLIHIYKYICTNRDIL